MWNIRPIINLFSTQVMVENLVSKWNVILRNPYSSHIHYVLVAKKWSDTYLKRFETPGFNKKLNSTEQLSPVFFSKAFFLSAFRFSYVIVDFSFFALCTVAYKARIVVDPFQRRTWEPKNPGQMKMNKIHTYTHTQLTLSAKVCVVLVSTACRKPTWKRHFGSILKFNSKTSQK